MFAFSCLGPVPLRGGVPFHSSTIVVRLLGDLEGVVEDVMGVPRSLASGTVSRGGC